MAQKRNTLKIFIYLFLLLTLLHYVISQMVDVTIFTESQCPYCTKLLREQVWKFHTTRPGIMNLQVI